MIANATFANDGMEFLHEIHWKNRAVVVHCLPRVQRLLMIAMVEYEGGNRSCHKTKKPGSYFLCDCTLLGDLLVQDCNCIAN
jgi:hypothetical protein